MEPLFQPHTAERGRAQPGPRWGQSPQRFGRHGESTGLAMSGLSPLGAGSANWSRTQAVPADCLCLRKAIGLWPMAGPALGPEYPGMDN